MKRASLSLSLLLVACSSNSTPSQGVCVAEDRTCLTDGPFVCGCDGSAVGLACIWGPGYAVVPVVNGTPGCTPDLDATID